MNTTLSHNNNFHLLRHLAAFFVLYAHAITINGNEEFLYHSLKGRIELSSLGVQIFFIISGYLVTQSLLQTDTRWRFARKRLLRLWPALFVVTLLLCVVMGPLLSNLSAENYFTQKQTWYFFLRNIIFLPVYDLPGVFNGESVNSTFWTLFFEMACYACLLLAGKKLILKYRKPIILSWVLVMLLRYFFLRIIPWPVSLQNYRYGITEMMFLFFTASIWLLFSRDRCIPSRKIWVAALTLFIATTILPLPGYFTCIRELSLLLFIVEWGRSKPVIHWPGWDISYGVYLIGYSVQMIIVYHASFYRSNAFTVFIATLLITVPLAFCLWYGIERPALRRK
ncbi:MAG: acyltransferase [Chitinophagaceae bacterium]